jgi:hypothetical protein
MLVLFLNFRENRKTDNCEEARTNIYGAEITDGGNLKKLMVSFSVALLISLIAKLFSISFAFGHPSCIIA